MVGQLPNEDIIEALSALPEAASLATAVREWCLFAAAQRDPAFLARGRISDPRADSGQAPPSGLPPLPTRTETPFGDVRRILEHGTGDSAERALIASLLALGVVGAFAELEEQLTQVVSHLVWLAANADCDAFEALDRLLSDRAARDVYDTVAVIAGGSLKPVGFGRLETLVAALLLGLSGRDGAIQAAQQLAVQAPDRNVKCLLQSVGPRGSWLRGEFAPPPRGTVLTVVLTVTLWLLIAHLGRLIGRFALAYRRPAEVRLGLDGLRVTWNTELLGKRLGEKSCLVPLGSVLRISREVRYARAGMYAGLAALVVGTFLGVGLILDGLRVPGTSGSLLWMGLVCLLGGIGLDFALTTLSDTLRGTCRLVVVPRKGRALCVGALSRPATDAMLRRLGQATASSIARA